MHQLRSIKVKESKWHCKFSGPQNIIKQPSWKFLNWIIWFTEKFLFFSCLRMSFLKLGLLIVLLALEAQCGHGKDNFSSLKGGSSVVGLIIGIIIICLIVLCVCRICGWCCGCRTENITEYITIRNGCW